MYAQTTYSRLSTLPLAMTSLCMVTEGLRFLSLLSVSSLSGPVAVTRSTPYVALEFAQGDTYQGQPLAEALSSRGVQVFATAEAFKAWRDEFGAPANPLA